MASSLLALLDDIATILDDISVMTKVALKKTSGVIGDDLALNAQQVTGLNADRELPVVWAVAKGSFVNKLILVPLALALSAFAPWLVLPLLMFGGAFLCFEGVEKLAHKYLHSKEEDDKHHKDLVEALSNEKVDLVALEKEKISGAVRTDFVLSAEIIIIALGVVAESKLPLSEQLAVLGGIGILMTVGVYGLVAGIVKLDDAGLNLSKREGSGAKAFGRFLLAGAPYLMKFLSVAGTVAMFTVGGSIIAHGIPPVHHAMEGIAHAVAAVPGVGGILGWIVAVILEILLGVATGVLALLVVNGVTRLVKKDDGAAAKH